MWFGNSDDNWQPQHLHWKVYLRPLLWLQTRIAVEGLKAGLDTALPFWVSVLQVLTMLLTKHLRMTICLKHSSVGYAVALLLWSADIKNFMTACAHCVESSESSGLKHLDRLTCRLAIKGLKMHQLNISDVGRTNDKLAGSINNDFLGSASCLLLNHSSQLHRVGNWLWISHPSINGRTKRW